MKTFRVKLFDGTFLGYWDLMDTPRSGDVVCDSGGQYKVEFIRWDRMVNGYKDIVATIFATKTL